MGLILFSVGIAELRSHATGRHLLEQRREKDARTPRTTTLPHRGPNQLPHQNAGTSLRDGDRDELVHLPGARSARGHQEFEVRRGRTRRIDSRTVLVNQNIPTVLFCRFKRFSFAMTFSVFPGFNDLFKAHCFHGPWFMVHGSWSNLKSTKVTTTKILYNDAGSKTRKNHGDEGRKDNRKNHKTGSSFGHTGLDQTAGTEVGNHSSISRSREMSRVGAKVTLVLRSGITTGLVDGTSNRLGMTRLLTPTAEMARCKLGLTGRTRAFNSSSPSFSSCTKSAACLMMSRSLPELNGMFGTIWKQCGISDYSTITNWWKRMARNIKKK